MTLIKPISPGKRVRLDRLPTDATGPFDDKDDAREALEKQLERLEELQEVLYAQGVHALLLVFQAMDAGGKDGAIKRIAGAFNPQGVRVASFKVPTKEELSHDFLWRIHKEAPGRGQVCVFNRSHYEDVLIVRVHRLVPEEVWRARYDRINAFEKLLAESGVTILKFFLHISKDEQKQRLEARRDDPSKRWKFNPGDLEERDRWGDYMRAYEEAISRTSTACAPWFVVPADHKWFRDVAIAAVVVDALERLDLSYPEAPKGIARVKVP
jgi:PPK2 family polyphosphate:nucleotide phosphotransferase